ncbi:DUF421 domain-containing protein [Halobacillus locisalis]|uniref:DUF421 domain-containing protein n=2 Tax=Halobacillus locisalis TaxID=220753 RepID=A0A838CSS2_9BACI|nr:DUF421 domain-containing protein [Halobacillus locisalis]
MGKRSVGELPVFDLLVLLVLGSVVGADIADPEIKHVHTVIAMIAIALLQRWIIRMKLKNRRIGKWLTFEPTIVIYNGRMIEKNISTIHYSIDNIIGMLREKGIFIIDDVELAIIEANGMMSVKKMASKEPVTRSDSGVVYRGRGYEVPLILDGKVEYDSLHRLHRDEAWLRQSLLQLGVDDDASVFYAAVTDAGELFVTVKDEIVSDIPPIYH